MNSSVDLGAKKYFLRFSICYVSKKEKVTRCEKAWSVGCDEPSEIRITGTSGEKNSTYSSDQIE